MDIVKQGDYHYLRHSFRKSGVVVHREKYLGKTVPPDLELVKEAFLRRCLQEALYEKLDLIKKQAALEWKTYPSSIRPDMLNKIAVDFTYNTNAIEGSTLTYEETADLLERGISPHRPYRDVKESLNNSKLFLGLFKEKRDLSLSLLLEWHHALFGDTKGDIAGQLREFRVCVGSYVAPDWQEVPHLMKDFFLWYQRSKKIMHPCELAARAHYHFEKIHPFGDGNGRVGRLLIVLILHQGSYPLLNIEYKKRNSYYRALSKTENDFLMYFMRRYLADHRRYID
ncbi:MAG TPA: Fic family protein [Candidatus Nanoarchaeia archaeon]|nr:Fic family protein [Candidatus Nanoarchaeia archaeon]